MARNAGWNQVADVAKHEKVSGIGRGEEIGHDSAVGAGHEKRIGFLLEREAREGLPGGGEQVLAKIDDALEEFFHGSSLGFLRPGLSASDLKIKHSVKGLEPVRGRHEESA